MVEEFMLLANISVAERIVDEFPECALLRSHPAPPPSNYDILVKAAKSKNIEIQVDSAKALAESLDRAAVPGAPPYLNTLLRILATRCMMQAIYFCSGMEPDTHHYGLATAVYTPFTSPIRRYSDVIVHRLLAVCVGADPTYPALTDKLGVHRLRESRDQYETGDHGASSSIHRLQAFLEAAPYLRDKCNLVACN
ncbi:exosome complex exonuclease RRP44-like [Petromyzon marinus]|uniref:exosome complex exonuclease RRP44-like n=1 Tax=Petromyzon marinus TaxID=7757 RepID=UPI003F70C45F